MYKIIAIGDLKPEEFSLVECREALKKPRKYSKSPDHNCVWSYLSSAWGFLPDDIFKGFLSVYKGGFSEGYRYISSSDNVVVEFIFFDHQCRFELSLKTPQKIKVFDSKDQGSHEEMFRDWFPKKYQEFKWKYELNHYHPRNDDVKIREWIKQAYGVVLDENWLPVFRSYSGRCSVLNRGKIRFVNFRTEMPSFVSFYCFNPNEMSPESLESIKRVVSSVPEEKLGCFEQLKNLLEFSKFLSSPLYQIPLNFMTPYLISVLNPPRGFSLEIVNGFGDGPLKVKVFGFGRDHDLVLDFNDRNEGGSLSVEIYYRGRSVTNNLIVSFDSVNEFWESVFPIVGKFRTFSAFFNDLDGVYENSQKLKYLTNSLFELVLAGYGKIKLSHVAK